jgi:hypothetical protein
MRLGTLEDLGCGSRILLQVDYYFDAGHWYVLASLHNMISDSFCYSDIMAVDKIDVVSDPRIEKCSALLNGRNYGEQHV